MARQHQEPAVGEIPTRRHDPRPAHGGWQHNVEVLRCAAAGVNTAYNQWFVSLVRARQRQHTRPSHLVRGWPGRRDQASSGPQALTLLGGERWASQKTFGLRLKERGFTSERVGRGKVHTWFGVGLAAGRGSIESPRPDAARCFGTSALSGPRESLSGTIEPHRAAAADRAVLGDGDDWGVV